MYVYMYIHVPTYIYIRCIHTYIYGVHRTECRPMRNGLSMVMLEINYFNLNAGFVRPLSLNHLNAPDTLRGGHTHLRYAVIYGLYGI